MGQEHDRIKVHFEIEDTPIDGGYEHTVFKKDVAVVTQIETHLESIIDLFIKFMVVYGFQKETVLNMMREFVEESE